MSAWRGDIYEEGWNLPTEYVWQQWRESRKNANGANGASAPYTQTTQKSRAEWALEYERWLQAWKRRVKEQREGGDGARYKTEDLLSAAAIINRGVGDYSWLVNGVKPKSGTGILSGASNSGKSTHTPYAIRALMRGEQWAFRDTFLPDPKHILLLSLEESEALTVKRLQHAGLTDDELKRVYLVTESSPLDELRMFDPCVWLARKIETCHLQVTKIDTMLDFIAFSSLTDYDVIQEGLVPLRKLSRDSNSYIELYFHLNRMGKEFGSARILAVVDVYMKLERIVSGVRQLSAQSDHGGKVPRGIDTEELAPVFISKDGVWNRNAGAANGVGAAGTRETAEVSRAVEHIKENQWIRHADLLKFIGVSTSYAGKAIETIVSIKTPTPLVRRWGTENQGYCYTTPDVSVEPPADIKRHIYNEWFAWSTAQASQAQAAKE